MSDYITAKEAAKLLNTTDRTIRRKLSAMSVQCPHLVRYVRKEGKAILIDKRLVLGNFERIEDVKLEQSDDIKEPEATAQPEKIELILLQQLSEKDKQIEGLQKHIGELTERNREQSETAKEPEKIEPILLQQLSEKDKQIDGLQKHIGELTERNREQNIIIGRMQAEREQIRIEAAKETSPPQTEPPTAEPLQTEPTAPPTTTTNSIGLVLLIIILFGVLMIYLNTL